MRFVSLCLFLCFGLAFQAQSGLPCVGQNPPHEFKNGRVCFGAGANAVLTLADGTKTKLLYANFWTDARYKRRDKQENATKGLSLCRQYFRELVAFGSRKGQRPEKIEVRLFWINRAPRVASDYRGIPAVGRVIVIADVRAKTCEFLK